MSQSASGVIDDRELLKELGAPPELPTEKKLKTLVAKIEPERLEQAKKQLKEAWKKKLESPKPVLLFPIKEEKMDTGVVQRSAYSEPSKINKTHILEMELLKLKGQFHKNKNTTKQLIKKFTNERELVKDSIKALSSTRRDELNLVDAIKRDNVELVHQKNRLEVDLCDLSERMEALLGNLGETLKNCQDKDARLQSMEFEKFELRRQIETLELKLEINNYAPQKECLVWRQLENISLPLNLKSLLILILAIVLSCYCYQKFTPESLPEAFCKDCDYERDIYTKIKL